MANERQFSLSDATHMQYFTDDDDDDEEEESLEDEVVDGELQEISSSGRRSLKFMCSRRRRKGWSLEQLVMNPRAKWVQEWNRVFLLVCATGLFVDPLFFYALSISDTCMCLYVDGWFAVTVTALRCMTDALHVWNMWLQLKMAKRYCHDGGGGGGEKEEEEGQNSVGTRGSKAGRVAFKYFKAKKGFFFDLLVTLPLPQVNCFL